MLQNNIELDVKAKCIEKKSVSIRLRRISALQAYMIPGSSIIQRIS